MKNLYTLFAAIFFALHPFLSFAQPTETDEIDQVRRYLTEHTDGLDQADLYDLVKTDRYVTTHNGVTHLYLAQSHLGVRIANTSASAAFDASGRVVGVFPRFLPVSTFTAESAEPSISARSAAEVQAARDVSIGLSVSDAERDGVKELLFTADGFVHKSKVELVYYAESEGTLRLAWKFNIDFPDHSHWYQYLVSAHTGETIEKIDLIVSCEPMVSASPRSKQESYGAPENMLLTPFDGSRYRVFPLPVESPSHGSRTLLQEPADPVASPYGWHDIDGEEGADYTITRGNNSFAYEDANDFNSPGFSPDGGAGLDFDFEFNPGDFPEDYQSAAIVNLFYLTNRLHDVLFHYGFDEAAGNFQETNYTGEGLDEDPLLAESQDGGGMNNANMATPEDGYAPRMQMYLWQVADLENEGLEVHEPSPLSGTYSISPPATFGPDLPTEGITANLILANDGVGDEYDLCSGPTNAAEIDGNIALVRRGSCNFINKVAFAQNAGAVAVIVVNNVPGAVIAMGGVSSGINIPSIMVNQSDGESFISALEDGQTMEVTLTGIGGASIRDGSFDNGVITHEFVHGLSNRLTGGPSSSGCLYNDEQGGEGWSDWYAIMLTIDMDAANPVYRPMATFAAGQPTDGTGIRPVPYDTSFAVNDFTYADLPSSTLTIPHGIGFVWATMLWDLSWAFMDQYGYDPDPVNGSAGNNMVMQLVTDGLKLQPCQPGFVDARDAILLADELANAGANKCLIWKAFAKRGLGFSANQGSSNSVYDGTAAFDLPTACQNAVLPPIADFDVNHTETCDGLVQFEDLSTQIPQSWLWDFGDGQTSTFQNPAHQYTQEGTYSVSLTVTNTLGENQKTQTNFIEYGTPGQPEGDDVSACAGNEVELTVSPVGEGEVRWRNAAMEPIGFGPSITVQAGEQDSTYYAEQVIGDPESGFVGPLTDDIGTGGYHQSSFVGTVDFVTYQPLIIVSAWVNSASIGTRTIKLWSSPGGAGTVLQSVNVNIDFTGPGRIDLEIAIDEPGDYSIGLNNAGLYRNDGGVSYPYVLADWMTITGSSAGSDHYYYFYDLEVQKPVCVGEPIEIMVQVTGSAQFEYTEDDLTLTFSAISEDSPTLVWDFGDGDTSSEPNPTHTYLEPGIYTVSHTTTDGCSSEMEITVGIVGLTSAETAGFTIYPNPTTDHLAIEFPNDMIGQNATIELYSASGALVLKKSMTADSHVVLKLSDLALGLYTASIRTDEVQVWHRVVVVE